MRERGSNRANRPGVSSSDTELGPGRLRSSHGLLGDTRVYRLGGESGCDSNRGLLDIGDRACGALRGGLASID